MVDLSKYLVKPGLYFTSNPDGGPCKGQMKSERIYEIIDFQNTVKLGYKEQFNKEHIGIKELFLVTILPFSS